MPKVEIVPGCEKALAASGLDGWEQAMSAGGGETFKKNKHRSVVRLEKGLFLKRHTRPEIKDKVRDLLSGRLPFSDADQERRNIETVAGLGIPTMKVAAWGEEGRGLLSRSFLVTEDLGALERLEDFLQRPMGRVEKRRLILAAAGLARRLHEAGLFHHDFYCGHILVRENGAGSPPTLYLIDLQRLRPHFFWPARWRAKDLSALDYTASPKAVGRADRLRFFLAYLGLPWRGAPRLTFPQKRFIRRILSRTAKTARHTAKKRLKYVR